MAITPKEKIVDSLYQIITKIDKTDVERAVDTHFGRIIDARDNRIAHLSKVVNTLKSNLVAPLGQGSIECTDCYGLGFLKDTSACHCVVMRCSSDQKEK
jgi:hypothetical protein